MITTKKLDIECLKSQLQQDEELHFLITRNWIPYTHQNERGTCKNGHPVFISNYMGLDPNILMQIKCDECDEIIFEYRPYAIRTRKLIAIETLVEKTLKKL